MAATATITAFSVEQDTEKDTVTVEYVIQSGGSVIEYEDALGAMPTQSDTYTVVGSTVYLKSRSVEAVGDSGKKVWRGKATWDNAPSSGSASTFTALETNVTAEGTDFWRVADAPPADVNNPSQTPLTTTALDTDGDPITVFVPQIEFTVTNFKATSEATTIANYVGRRNSATFLGITAGYLLFTGASSRRVSQSKYEITYKFVFDWFGHCRQVALADAGGIIKGAETGSPPVRHATAVVWRQPFPATAAFSGLGIVTA